jgi:antitoxin (DNA-binding transcriptional repressor) of toxin-antitoxin stability system
MVAVGMLLVGCAGQVASKPAAPGPSSPGTAKTGAGSVGADPAALIGSWALIGVDEDAGVVLRLAPDDAVSLFRRCAEISGVWGADANGLFVAHLFESSVADTSECGPSTTPGWLRRATGFRVERGGPVLVDDRGGLVARLLPGGTPTVGPNPAPSRVALPEVTGEDRRTSPRATALPADLVPAGHDALLGRWVPAIGPRGGPDPAYVELRDDGEWRGSDGCNGQRGRWVAGPAGVLLVVSGYSTLMGCDNVPVTNWLSAASWAGLDGEVLVLLDGWGKETGRLRRDR